MIKKEVFIEFVCFLLVILFLYTGVTKLVGHDAFERALRQAPLLKKYSTPVAIALPMIEIVVAVMMAIPKTRPAGLKASLALLSTFTFYLFYMVAFYEKLPCNCGGVISKMSWRQHIFFNLCFLVLNMTAIKTMVNLSKPALADKRTLQAMP